MKRDIQIGGYHLLVDAEHNESKAALAEVKAKLARIEASLSPAPNA